jgi:hypothetical protein
MLKFYMQWRRALALHSVPPGGAVLWAAVPTGALDGSQGSKRLRMEFKRRQGVNVKRSAEFIVGEFFPSN